MNKIHSSVLSLILSCFFVFCSACKRENVVSKSIHTQELHLGNGTEPVSLDPHVTSGLSAMNVHMALFEGLTSFHPKTLRPEPAVASSWDISEDLQEYTFHLRPDAKWSNGEALTAHDFVYGWKRSLTKELGAPFASFYFMIEGAEAYYEGELDDFSQVGIEALDDYTLKLRLKNPLPYVLSILAHHAFAPVYRKTIEKFDAFSRVGTGWDRPGDLIGNGPFVLSERVHSKWIKVVKNPYYWDADKVRLEAIYFYPYDSLLAEENAFLAKQIHKTESLSAGKAAWYERKMPDSLRLEPYFATYYYALNTRKAPLNDARVRRALSLAINRSLITDKLLGGGRLPAKSFTPPGLNLYKPPELVKEDIQKARQLLADAGYPDGKGFPEVELLFNTSEFHRLLAEAIQEMWKKNLGIEIHLRNEEWKSCLESRKAGKFDVLRSSWIADYADVSNFLELLASNSNNNFPGYSNERYDALLKEAATKQDEAERVKLFTQAETILLKDMPIIPIFYYTSNYLIHSNVQGWYSNPLNIHPYKYVWIGEEEE